MTFKEGSKRQSVTGMGVCTNVSSLKVGNETVLDQNIHNYWQLAGHDGLFHWPDAQ